MRRVAALYRWSSRNQVKQQFRDDVDIQGQKAAVLRFLETRPEWVLIKEYHELGVSAYSKTWDQRPELVKLLEDAKKGMFDVLCVFREDRLSRGGPEQIRLLDDLRISGVEVWSVADSKHLSLDGFELAVRGLEAVGSREESKKISQRAKEGKLTSAQSGRFSGGRIPFGYDLRAKVDSRGQPVVKGTRIIRELVPHEVNAGIVREIYRKYLAGAGQPELVRWLNTSGIESYFGNGWTTNTLRRLLTNEIYVGKVAYNVGWRAKRDGLTPQCVEGHHEAIIDAETFDQVQHMLEVRRRVPSRQRGNTHPLTGVIYCKCGARMGAITRSPNARQRFTPYMEFRCRRWVQKGVCPHSMRSVKATVVEQSFLDEMERKFILPGGFRETLEEQQTELQQQMRDQQEARRQAEVRLKQIEQAISKLDRTYFESEAISLEEWKRTKAQYAEEKATLELQLAQWTESVAPARDVTALVEMAKQLHRLWPKRSATEKRTFALDMLDAWGYRAVVDLDGTVTFVRVDEATSEED